MGAGWALAAGGCKSDDDGGLDASGGGGDGGDLDAGDGSLDVDGGPRDIGPGDWDLGVLHDLTELTIEGSVRLDFSSPAPNVQVVVHCGESTQESTTGDDGGYAVTTNVEQCNYLVVEFTKESYLPTYRVIHLPPPTSPVTLDVDMTILQQLLCGTKACVVEGDPVSRFPPGPMTRGWVAVHHGPSAVDYFGGEFRDTQGNLLWVTGFGYFDLRDDSGATLESFEPFDECFGVGFDALAQLVDMLPDTDEVEMNVFTLDTTQGRWVNKGPVGYVAYTDDYDAEGNPLIVPAARAQKNDIRSGQFQKQVWVCAPLSGSGWTAWGVAVRPRACISFQATNQCQYPLANVVVSLKGRGFGYKATSWTDRRGKACLEASRSENLDLDYNHNELNGETFWVDADLTHQGISARYTDYEMPREEATCAQPENCIALTHRIEDFTIERCP